MSPLQKIMVVSDAGTRRSTAYERALWLARNTGAALHVCLLDRPGDAGSHEAFLSQRETWLREEAQIHGARRVTPSIEVLCTAEPLPEILAHAVEFGADLLIKDALPVTALRRLLPERLNGQLLRECPCPVLLVHEGPHAIPKHVLAAIDLDDEEDFNQRIVGQALGLSIQCDAELHLAHAFDPLLAAEALPPLVPTLSADQYSLMARLPRQTFEAFADGHGVPDSRRHFLIGTVSSRLATLADELATDVLVIGTVRRTGLDRLLIGSTALALLDRVHCDVLAVKPAALSAQLADRIRAS